MASIAVHDLGVGGVNVDKSPLQTDDNETRVCQNATYDGTRERLGGLTKRPGLARFNTIPFTAPILGGCEAPYAGTATAGLGSGGGGVPGTSGGTGGATQAETQGGGTAPGDDVRFGSGGSLLQASVTTGGAGGPIFFNGRRLLLIGRGRVSGGPTNLTGVGWYLTSEQFQDAAWLTGSFDSPDAVTGAGPPGSCAVSVPGTGHRASPAASAIVNGWLYYPAQIDSRSGTAPADTRGEIRRTNGYTDESIARIEKNPWDTDSSQANRIVSMLTIPNNAAPTFPLIAISVCDKGQTSGGETATTNPDWGRLFYLNPQTNFLQEHNTDDPTTPAGLASVPFALAWYVDRMFYGGFRSDGTSNDATIWYANVDAAPILDLKQDAPYFRTSCMAVYAGQLFAGYQMRSTDANPVTFAQVWKRPAAPATPAGTLWATTLTATGGSAVADNRFVSMVVFKDELYVSYWNNTQTAKIYKYDGTTWTTQLTQSTVSTRGPYYLYVDTNSAGTATLYAFALSENNTMVWLFSTDGSTFTNRTSTVESGTHGTTFATSFAMPIFFAFDQK